MLILKNLSLGLESYDEFFLPLSLDIGYLTSSLLKFFNNLLWFIIVKLFVND